MVGVAQVRLFEYALMALSEIWNNKVRTFLTLIGIVIGISAVILIIYIVQGAGKFIVEQYSSLQPVDMVRVYPESEDQKKAPRFSLDDVDYLKKQLGGKIKAAAAVGWTRSFKLRYRGSKFDCEVIPTTRSYTGIYGMDIDRGRFLTDIDLENKDQVIVLGYETAEQLFPGQNPLGKEVVIHGTFPFTVVGILSEEYQSPIFPAATNNTRAFIPLSVMERLEGNRGNFYLMLRAKTPELASSLQTSVIEKLNLKYGLTSENQSKFMAYNMGGMMNEVNILEIVLMILLGGAASITLLVAGIGVMNIMLVIVIERTKEIGLRKALGATRRDILTQFIIESLILCLVGGITGIIVGYLGSGFVQRLASDYFEVKAVIPSWAIIVSLIFTTGVGLFFGIYPAVKASRLDPIEALHYE